MEPYVDPRTAKYIDNAFGEFLQRVDIHFNFYGMGITIISIIVLFYLLVTFSVKSRTNKTIGQHALYLLICICLSVAHPIKAYEFFKDYLNNK